jgi:hypothetical protein
VKFFVGIPEPSMAQHFARVCISVNRTRRRAGPFAVKDWMMDGAGFTQISTHGDYSETPNEYAAEIRRQKGNGNLVAAVAQDWMCEPRVIRRTGLSVSEYQRRTIERYDDLIACDTGGVYVLPVLQGWTATDYTDHVEAYGDRLAPGAWVGVGSVCKRNVNPISILRVLYAIHGARPDLRLHGFGVKVSSLEFQPLRDELATADSMAWSYAARKQGRDQNDWHEAQDFAERMGAGGEG